MDFQEFLNRSKSVTELTKEIVVGDRFKNEDGKDFTFTIRSLSGKQIDACREAAKKGNRFNVGEFNTKLVCEACTYPNFKDAQSIKERGLHSPAEYLNDVLLPGEIDILSLEIQKLCGYNVSVNELIEEAKN